MAGSVHQRNPGSDALMSALLTFQTDLDVESKGDRVRIIAVQEQESSRTTMVLKSLSLRETEVLIHQLQQAVGRITRHEHRGCA